MEDERVDRKRARLFEDLRQGWSKLRGPCPGRMGAPLERPPPDGRTCTGRQIRLLRRGSGDGADRSRRRSMRPTETVGRVLQLSMAKTENEREEGEEKSQVRGVTWAAAGWPASSGSGHHHRVRLEEAPHASEGRDGLGGHKGRGHALLLSWPRKKERTER